MNIKKSRLLPAIIMTTVLSYSLILIQPVVGYAADTRPYLKTWGSDVMTGGWFNDNSGVCDTSSASNYQDSTYANVAQGWAANKNTGGILTYAKQSGTNSAGGASSQYGVLSLGAIDGAASGGVYGFYGAGTRAGVGGTSKYALNFANNNTGTDPWGGRYELGTAATGGLRAGSCIPDYYDNIPTGSDINVKTTGDQLDSFIGTNGSYSIDTAGAIYNLTNSDITVPAGTHVTVYVNGNVYIGHNITYAPYTADNITKFALVVRGSIYIEGSSPPQVVNQLDGFYVAQPPNAAVASDISADKGDIWTCHPNGPAGYSYTQVPLNCTNPLVVNGALVAKQLNFYRIRGDINAASPKATTSEDKTAAAGPANCGFAVLNNTAATDASCSNIAEIINYTPAAALGGGFFSTSTTSDSAPLDSVTSLPPAF